MLKRPDSAPKVSADAVTPGQNPEAPHASQDQSKSVPISQELEGKTLQNPEALLGVILVQEGHITEAQLTEGLKKHQEEGGFLGQSLVELNYIDQQTLSLILIKQCKIPHLNLLDYQLDPEVASIIPEQLCRKHKVLPIDKMGRILTVAMVDPLNAATLTALRSAFPDLRIKPILCDWTHYETCLGKLFGNQPSKSTEAPASMTAEDFGLKTKPKLPKTEPKQEIASPPDQSDSMEDLQLEKAPVENSTPTFSIDTEENVDDSVLLETLTDTVADSIDKQNEAQEVLNHAKADLRHSGIGTGTISQLSPQNSPSRSDSDARVLESLESGMPATEYSFTNFFPGKTNDVTYKTACAVAETPGGAFNPLFVYGKVGLGKTHLINAIGNQIVTERNNVRVGCTSASRFANHLMEAKEAHAGKAFREQYSHWDILILDDIQFLGGHIEAQEEFFHIFNSLYQQGRQIIIAGDKTPEKLGMLEQRLVSRFASGMVSALNPPEWETRIEVLKHSAVRANLTAPDEVFAMIAMRVSNDVRMLLGALQKVMALAKLQNIPVSAELTNTILTEMGIEEAA